MAALTHSYRSMEYNYGFKETPTPTSTTLLIPWMRQFGVDHCYIYIDYKHEW